MNIMVDYFTFISPKLIKCFSNVHETKIKYSKILLKMQFPYIMYFKISSHNI